MIKDISIEGLIRIYIISFASASYLTFTDNTFWEGATISIIVKILEIKTPWNQRKILEICTSKENANDDDVMMDLVRVGG